MRNAIPLLLGIAVSACCTTSNRTEMRLIISKERAIEIAEVAARIPEQQLLKLKPEVYESTSGWEVILPPVIIGDPTMYVDVSRFGDVLCVRSENNLDDCWPLSKQGKVARPIP